jgi:hypothetical protein
MATTTPNFGWTVPTSTDLVKDGATAIETLGDSIDASFVDLKGGTAGQVLAKASGTDLDFAWVAQDDSNAIQNSIVDAKGDLIGATAADTPARLAVGTNGQILTADSTAATGLAWATPASSASGLTLIKTQTIGSGVSSVNVTSAFSSTYDNYKIFVSGGVGSGNINLNLTLGATATGYYRFETYMTFAANTITGAASSNATSWAASAVASANSLCGDITLIGPNLAKTTHMSGQSTISNTTSNINYVQGFLNNTTQYTDFTLTCSSGTLTGGTIKVYGYQNS